MQYAYRCPNCGTFDHNAPLTAIQCRCGREARRAWSVAIHTAGAKDQSRWDPMVGEFVRNTREFYDALAKGRDAQEKRLGMEVKWETVPAGTHTALNEMHGMTAEDRAADLEPTLKAARDGVAV